MWDWQRDNTLLSLLSAALAISLIVIAFLIYSIKKLKTNSCGCCKGKKSHSYNNPSNSIWQNWIHVNAVFSFYNTAAVALQRTAATVSVDHQIQQVRYIKKRCSWKVISMSFHLIVQI